MAAAKYNREQVTAICEDLRSRVESTAWSHKGGKTDWAIILTALDIAQHTGHLNVFLDARSMSFAAGVAPTTASHSLGRLVKDRWLIENPKNSIHPKHRVPKNRANEYLVNPGFPHVYRFVYPSRDPGERWLVSAGVSESADVTTGEVFPNLISVLRDGSNTYTHADTRRALLIGRTELGVMLGPTAVRLALKADDEPRTIKELARLAKVESSNAGKIIRRKLSPKGLLSNAGGTWFELATHPGMGWWEGGKWVRGIPLEEYKVHPSNNKVGWRLEGIAAQREKWQEEHQQREDEWIDRELSRMAEMTLPACV